MLRLNLMTKPLQSVSIKNVGGIEVDGEELAGDWRCTQRRASRDVGLRCLRLDPAPECGTITKAAHIEHVGDSLAVGWERGPIHVHHLPFGAAKVRTPRVIPIVKAFGWRAIDDLATITREVIARLCEQAFGSSTAIAVDDDPPHLLGNSDERQPLDAAQRPGWGRFRLRAK
jgi:hypothetical protein